VKTNGARRELEHKADVTRARLLGTIEALDRRRRELLDFKLQLRRHAGDFLVAFGGLLIGVGATTAVVFYREKQQERRLRRERIRAIVRLWKHPERIAAQRSPLATGVRMMLVALVSMATTTVATHRLEKFRRAPRLPRPPTEPLGV
jgi:hypothetical protein